jgi:carbon storage regulator
LILSRQAGESILIGDYEVTVCEIRKGQVKIGVSAPKEIPVDRRELRLAKERVEQ